VQAEKEHPVLTADEGLGMELLVLVLGTKQPSTAQDPLFAHFCGLARIPTDRTILKVNNIALPVSRLLYCIITFPPDYLPPFRQGK
jgi:hypothetical protein